jgi:uncharacterized protein YbjQ (UPF0145 family)
MCEQARDRACEEMLEHARSLGGNAVVGFIFDATEVARYGTAVRVVKAS